MNLNNKYLAVGLSIAAVVVVSYQVFFNKPTKPVRQPMQDQPMFSQRGKSNQPHPPVATPAPAPPAPTTATPGKQMGDSAQPPPQTDGLTIDYHSEILLSRISPDMVESYPRQELPQEFGTTIFSKGEDAPAGKEGPKYQREVEYKLNAIIIDRTRRIAIINDTILSVGDMIQGAQVVSIVKSRVVLTIEKKTILLSTNSRIKKVKLIGGKGEN